MTSLVSIALCITAACSSVTYGLAQGSGLPTVSEEAIRNEGQIVTSYDPFTEHTKTEVLMRIHGERRNGLNLYAYFVYPDEKLAQHSDVYIGLVSISDRVKYENLRDLSLLVGRERQDFSPLLYSLSTTKDGSIVELLLLPSTFTRDELLKLAKTKGVKVTIRGHNEIELTEKQLGLLSELAVRMLP